MKSGALADEALSVGHRTALRFFVDFAGVVMGRKSRGSPGGGSGFVQRKVVGASPPYLFNDHACPSVCVRLDAVLDVAQHVVKFRTDGAGLSVLAYYVTLLVLQVIYAFDG